MSETPTHHFGRYELVGLLGRGGMGEVWLGKMAGAAGWQKLVAIKRLLPHLAQDSEFLARFIDEGRLAAALSHGNIASIFDMGVIDDEHFVAMEYVDGLDLREALRLERERGSRVPVECAVLVATEVCKALEFAHTRHDSDGNPLGIVHRDVSPSNVLVSRAGEVKLVDFGIAAAHSRSSRTLTGQLRGKLSYMSPEQASGARVDPRSDVFALGAVLYEMLSGKRAFDGDSEPEVLARVQAARFSPLREYCPELDPELVVIVERALQRAPADRFESAEAFGVALMRFLMRDTGPVTQRRVATWIAELAPSAQPQPRAPRRNAFDALLDEQRAAPAPNDATRTASGPALVQSQPVRVPDVSVVSAQFVGPVVAPAPARARLLLPALAALALVLVVSGLVFLRSPPVEVQIRSTPAEANVYVDGVAVGTTPLRTRLSAGPREIRVSREGYLTATHQWTEQSDETLVEVDLVAQPAPVVFESVPPGAFAQIDDGARFVAGNAAVVQPGVSFRLRMELEGHEPFVAELSLEPGVERYTARLAPRVAVAGQPVPPPTQALPTNDTDPPEATNEPPREVSLSEAERVWRLRGVPETAVVRIDGTVVSSNANIRRSADAGAFDLTVEAAGFARFSRRIDPAEQGSGELVVALVAEAELGQLQLFFPEPPMLGTVRINGQTFAAHDWQRPLDLPSGRHMLEVVNESFDVSHRAEFTVEAGATTRHMVAWRPI